MPQNQPISLSELIEKVGTLSKGRLSMRISGADVKVGRFMPPKDAHEEDLSFLTDPRYAAEMKESRAGALVLREKDAKAIFGEELPARTILPFLPLRLRSSTP